MRRGVTALGLSACLLLSSVSLATAEEETDPSDLARESIELMMRSLNLMIERIPQYELPEVNENGDIIIRRKRSTGESKPEEDSEQEKTRI